MSQERHGLPGDLLPALGPSGEGWVLLQLMGFAAVLAGALWRVDLPQPVKLVGALLVVLGILLLLVAALRLGPSLTPLPRPKEDAQLVQEGIYAKARHPIYGGVMLLCLGYSLWAGSFVSLGASAATFVVLLLKSLREEAWLHRRYPGYAAYRERTRRFIPWLV